MNMRINMFMRRKIISGTINKIISCSQHLKIVSQK